MNKGLRTTLIGGIIFLVPLIFVLIILGKAHGIALKVATPISKIIPIESFGGVALVNILAGLAIVLVCYLAGLMARSSMIAAKVDKVDQFLTRAIPSYHSTKKGFIDSIDNKSFEDEWTVVLIGPSGEKRALGFEIDRLKNGDVVVFQPLSPNTRSGFVWSVPPDQVEALDINPRDLSEQLTSYGVDLSSSL